MRDPYSMLGVKRDAGSEEIKAAWRAAAKASHPDQNREDPQATQRFAELGRAYEVLKDPAKRQRYDRQKDRVDALKREQTIQQQRELAEKARQAKANAERVLEELARAEAERAKSEKPKADQKGAAKPAGAANGKAAESPEEMVSRIFGETPEANAAAQNIRREREAKVEGAEHADHPDGKAAGQSSGKLDPIEFIASLLRKITGAAPQPEKAPDMFAEATVTIEEMLKPGWVSVTLPDGRDIRFGLEAGYNDGQLLRLKGQGYKIQGMQRGDVSVTLKVARHDRFTVEGYDIHTILPVTLENAVLGYTTKVETLDGEAEVTVPPWSSSDHSIRLEGRGLPDGGGGRGAFVVDLRVVLWEKPDDKVTDLMRHMREGLYL